MIKKENISGEYFCVNGSFDELERIREFVYSKAAAFGFSDNDAHYISLAVDEACTNIIKHAYKFADNKKICINIETTKNQLTVNIKDDGPPFNLLNVPAPNMIEYLRNYNRGGLGIHIIKKVMDDIKYYPSNETNNYNLLKLIKNCPKN